MFNINEDLFSGKTANPVFPRYTLDNPILPYNRKFLYDFLVHNKVDGPVHVIKEAESLQESIRSLSQSSIVSVKSEKKYPLLFSPTLLAPYPFETNCAESPIKSCVTQFLLSLKTFDHFPEWSRCNDSEIENVRAVLDSKELQDLIYWNDQIVKVRNCMSMLQTARDQKSYMIELSHPSTKLNFLYTANFAIMYENRSFDNCIGYIFDYDQICGIVDTSVGRTLTIESANLHKSFGISNMPSPAVISKVYVWGDRQLAALGNQGYKVLKTFESITRTMVLRNEPYDYCRSFHQTCLNDLKDILIDLNIPQSNFEELKLLLDSIGDLECSEIAGIYRHWMHPTVDEEAGMRKVKNISDQKKPISSKLVRRIKAAFNRSFVQEYIAHNRKWPSVKFIGRAAGPLKNWVNRKSLIFDESANNYNWESWADIAFGKTFEFDYKVDVLDLLDDKACALPKNMCHQIFYKKFAAEDWCKDREQRRVLINLLSKEEFDTKEIIDRIIKRDIPDEWKVVGLHAKEREMKLEPRLFAILPPEIRAYFVLTEHNIAKYLFKYFPQQTMNLDEDQLNRRLLQLASPKGDQQKGKKQFTANLDFKSWNIYWTREAVEAIFIQIGCLFGMPNLYTFTHLFFEIAMHYLSSYCCPPEKWQGGQFSEKDKCDCHLWFGHYGGLEGLRQKGWTLVTIAMLELVKLETEIESIISGQGDNQVIIFFITEILTLGLSNAQVENYYTKAIQKYIKTIHEISEGMGQQLKIEETWVSSRIIEYGKDLLLDGIFVSSVYKRVSRALEITNELTPGLQSQIGHVFSVLQSACAKGFSWLPMYIQALLICDRVLKNYLDFDLANPSRGRKQMTKENYTRILQMVIFIPRSIGGLACLPFTEFILRGHPDPITSALVHMRLLENQVEIIPPYITSLLKGNFFAKEADFLMLATAPDALNLDNVRTEQNIWKSLVRTGCSHFVKNKMFKEIIDLTSDNGERELIQWMMTIDPVFPRFLSIIYSATIYGAMAKVIGRFGNNKTLVHAAGANEVKKSITLIRRSHNKQWDNLMSVCNDLKNEKSTYLKNMCCTTIAQKLRDMSWKQSEKSEGIYGSTVPHPFEQVQIIENKTGDCYESKKCFGTPYIFFQVQSQADEEPRHISRGKSEPYLSGRIRPKREQGIVHTTVLDAPIIAAAQLASNKASVCDSGTAMDDSIVNIIESRTNIPIPIVESLIGRVYGGTLWHRLPDQYTSHEISLNCRPNITTHVYISTDTMAKYSRGARDYTLPYQSIFIAVNALLSDASARGKLPKETIVLHAHLKCEECTREIDPIKMTCPAVYVNQKGSLDNPLIFSKTSTLPLSARDLIQPPHGLIDNRNQGELHRICAISHLVTHRYHTSIQVAMRGLTPIRRFKTDLSLRLGDIIAANPSKIIRKVALYLLMSAPSVLSPSQYENQSQLLSALVLFVNMSGHHLWENIGHFATLPEFVDCLQEEWPLEDPGMDYGKGGNHTYRFLSRLLIKTINTWSMSSSIYKQFKQVRLYNSDPNWSAIMYSAQHMIITLWLYSLNPMSSEEFQSIIQMPHIPTEQALMHRIQACLMQIPSCRIIQVLQMYSPRVRPFTPEADARCTTIIERKLTSLKHMLSADIPNTIRLNLKLNQIECTFSNIVPSPVKHDTNPRVVSKMRKDHEYKLVGNASTAMYKWICALYHLNLRGTTTMTLGEGAGGLARALLEVFQCDSVVFNTLIDAKEFDPHRVTSYVPSELRQWFDRIHELSFCCEHGGDLLEEKTVARYSSWKDISLVTCDAEVGTDDYEKRLLLVANVATIARQVLKDDGYLLLKSFIQNPNTLTKELLLVSYLFNSVSVFYTTESSYENYEVFIQASGLRHDSGSRYLSLNTISSLISLGKSRIHSRPIQEIYKEEHKAVSSLLNFRSDNMVYSLRVFSNNLLEPSQWTVHQITAYQIEIVCTIEQRMRTHKNLVRSSNSHSSNVALVGAIVSEERFLNLMSVWYINLEILKGLLLLKNEEPWEYRFKVFNPTTAYLKIPQLDLEEYEQRYARHFYHLLGHAKRL